MSHQLLLDDLPVAKPLRDELSSVVSRILVALANTSKSDATVSTPTDEDGPGLSRAEFCEAEQISLSTYFKMKRNGTAPEETIIPGTTVRRITAKARREWRAKIAEYSKSDAAKLEEQRRRDLASRAGQRAAASPLHVSKQPRHKRASSASAPRKSKMRG